MLEPTYYATKLHLIGCVLFSSSFLTITHTHKSNQPMIIKIVQSIKQFAPANMRTKSNLQNPYKKQGLVAQDCNLRKAEIGFLGLLDSQYSLSRLPQVLVRLSPKLKWISPVNIHIQG